MRGLRDFIKCKTVFLKFKESDYDIIFLQECHSAKADTISWSQQWGNKIFYNHGTQQARGVMILFKLNILELNPIKVFEDNEGRVLGVKIRSINNTDSLLVNVYGPNSDTPLFFENLNNMIRSSEISTIIMAGDFNVPLNYEFDTTAQTDSHNKSRKILSEMMEKLNLWDIWRAKNTGELKYTWYRLQSKVMSRLDYFLISGDIVGEIDSPNIQIPIHSDHCLIDLKWTEVKTERGRGLWKHNNALLYESNYVDGMNSTIKEAVQTFSRSDYIIRWEMVKQKCIEFHQEYAIKRSIKTNDRKTLVEKKIESLLAELSHRENDKLGEELRQYQLELEDIENKRTESAVFRTKSNWYELGEKSSKYFFGLEKSHFRARNITKLVDSNGDVIYSNNEILTAAIKFYEVLYTSINHAPFNFINEGCIKSLTSQRSKKLYDREYVTETEIGEVLALFKNSKTPGCDGLTSEFYKMFWPHLKTALCEYYNKVYEDKKMGWSARKGVLTLIPKKGKDTLYLKNWRPITLLNLDYKILSKVLARKLQGSLPAIVSAHQTGFMKGRNIRENIRKTIEITNKAQRDKIKAIIFSLDFQKCFDLCRHEALIGSLEYFGFHQNFISWVKLLFTEFSLCVQNNGVCSHYIKQTRGLHQGCCYSPLGYLLCGELFSIILHSTELEGFKYNDIMTLLSQFADDSDLFPKYNKKMLHIIVEALSKAEDHLGLKVNYEKSSIYQIGSLKNSDAKLYTVRNIVWTELPLKVLGVHIHDSITERIELNFNPLIDKVESVLSLWKSRKCTLTGRILIINTLVESLFVHKMQCIELLLENMYKKFHEIILNFVWQGKKNKISHTSLSAPKLQGGLRLANLKYKQPGYPLLLKMNSFKNVLKTVHTRV